MRRVGKWLLRGLGVVGVVVAALLLLYVTLAPWLVRRAALNALRDAGLADADLRVRSVSLHHLQLTDLQSPGGQVQLASAGASYSPASLWDGRVEMIDLTGAQWRINVRDGRVELGSLFAGTAGGGKVGELPFDQLRLRGSSVLIDLEGWELRVPVEATIDARQPGVIRVDAGVAATPLPINVSGTIERSANGAGETLALNFTVSAQGHGPPLHLKGIIADGKFNADASFEAGEATHDAGLTLDALFTSASDGGLAFAATAGFRFRGGVPVWLRDLAREYGVRLDGLGPIALQGDATFRRSTGPNADAAPWVIEANNVELSLGEGTLGVPDAEMELVGVGGDAKLAFSLSPRGVELRLLPRSLLRFVPQESRGLPVNIRNAQPDARYLALRPTGEGLRLTLPFGQTPSLEGGLQLDPFDLVHEPAQFALTGVTLQLPIAINTPASTSGKLAVKELRWGDDTFPPVAGAVSLVDRRLLAHADWSPVAGAELHADAWFDVLGRRGHIDVNAPSFVVSDDEALGRQVSALKPYKIRGTFAVDGQIDVAPGRVEPNVRLTLVGVDLRSEEYDGGVDGITGSVTINNLAPLATPGDQRLNIKTTHFGKLALHDGLIAFRLERVKSIFIEKTEWRWGEKGRFFIHAFRFDPAKGEADLEVFLEEMNLNEWLTVLTDGRVTGQGTMFGRLPVRIRREAANRIAFGEGFLYAKPGVGNLQVRDTQMADNLLTQSDPRFATDDRMRVVKERTIAALRDFDYSWLRFDFVKKDDGLTLEVRMNGKGHVGGPTAQEVTLNVNVNGFDELLRGALFLKLGTPEAIDSALQRVFGQ